MNLKNTSWKKEYTSSGREILPVPEFFAAIHGESEDGVAVVVSGAPLPDADGWLLMLGFLVGHGRMDLVAHMVMRCPDEWHYAKMPETLCIQRFLDMVELPTHTKGRLTAAVIRSAATTELELWTRRWINYENPKGSAARSRWSGEVESGPTKKQTRPGAEDLKLARIARRYVELVNTQNSTTPRLTLMEETGFKENTIQSYLYMARKRGLLTSSGGRGFIGGELTDRAVDILRRGGI